MRKSHRVLICFASPVRFFIFLPIKNVLTMCSSSSSSLSESGGESDTERHDSKKTVKKARHIETKEDLEKIR